MPYIPKKDRKRLDVLIRQLGDEIEKVGDEYCKKENGNRAAYAGFFNYSVSQLVGRFARRNFRYWNIALLSGVLENIKDEFYRRVAILYEDEKIRIDSDISEYKEISKIINNKNNL